MYLEAFTEIAEQSTELEILPQFTKEILFKGT